MLNRNNTKLITHAKDGSKRQIGDTAEGQMKFELKDINSTKIISTKNSGATNMDGDFLLTLSNIEGDYLRCEGKYRNTDGFTVSKKHWNEICKKSIIHGGVPALVTKNKSNKTLITMELKHFATLLDKRNE